MPWVDEVGWVEDTPQAPASYADQVALAQSWGVPADQIASVVGTPQSVAANNQAQAQAIQELTGSAPSWSQDVGYTAPPPSWLNPADYTANNYAAPYTQQQITGQVDPSWIRQMNGQTYASVKGPSDLSGGEYLIDPNTGRFALDKNGNPIGVTYPKSNNFDDWVTTPQGGLTLMALLAAGGMGINALAGAGALGAGATETTLGSLGAGGAFTPVEGASFGITPGAAYTTGAGSYLTPTLMGPTYAELGYTGIPEGAMGPTYAELGYTGLNQSQAIAAADAAAAAAAAGSVPSWLSSLAAPLSKLGTSGLASGLASALKQGGGTSGISPSLLSSLGKLAQGQSGMGMEIPGIVRTNTNPFYNTPQVALQTPQKTEMSTLSDLLRQGKSSWQT